jgi:hypothetical protein
MASENVVRQHLVQLPYGRTKTLGELIDGWSQHVERFYRELSVTPSAEMDVWGVHDYIGALHIRDLIAEGIAQLSSDNAAIADRLTDVADQVFRSFTRSDSDGFILDIAGVERADSWWWYLIPKSGPVLEEAIQIKRR